MCANGRCGLSKKKTPFTTRSHGPRPFHAHTSVGRDAKTCGTATAAELTPTCDEFKYRAQASSAQVAEAPVDWCVADLDAEEHEARVEGGREHEGEQ